MQTTVLIDDIDGNANDVETVSFSFGKQTYEIDLGPENRQRLSDALSPFIDRARRVRKPVPKPARNTEQNNRKIIREWARNHGHSIPKSGRLPTEIIDAYNAANPA